MPASSATSPNHRPRRLLVGAGIVVTALVLLVALATRRQRCDGRNGASKFTQEPSRETVGPKPGRSRPPDGPLGDRPLPENSDTARDAALAFLPPSLPLAERSDRLDQALRQPTLPEGFAEALLSIARDRAAPDADWRDYCVQVLPDCHNRLPPDNPLRTEIVAVLRDILDESANAVAGTALLGLDRLGEADNALAAESAIAAVRLASNDAAHPSARVTALRVAASHGAVDALPAARVLAQVGETPLLRLAAIATLGDLGDASDRELLLSLSISSDKRSRSATASAVERLDHRLSSPPATP